MRTTTFLFFAATLCPLRADVKDNLRVEVEKISLERHDQNGGTQGYSGMGDRTIDRKMALNIFIENNSIKALPATTVDYVAVIQRWGSESGSLERTQGQLKLQELRSCQSATLKAGEIHISGHMHGTSAHHVDRIAGWKVTITRDGKKLDFMSSPNFEDLNKRAK